MAEIRWTSEAEIWLRDIHDYIAEDNPYAAAEVAQAIYEKVQTLRQFPDIGYIYRSETAILGQLLFFSRSCHIFSFSFAYAFLITLTCRTSSQF